MDLKVLLPNKVFFEAQAIAQIVVMTPQGSYGFLPQRQDCVAALVPGILMYQPVGKAEQYIALDQGVLVKTGLNVRVSVRNAIAHQELNQLRDAIERQYLQLDEQEQQLRAVLAKMESGFIRHLIAFNSKSIL
ncbi:F0F1 ATP synthase subunit epsilon [Alishewanella sp. SMS9]|uniref:F0F1 ATP synthase subunit epsilon n=1 Tax=Pseudoalteromonas tunicata TaxID=314281 RepID=UPI00273D807A|nr:F0F1 ATP synthase subunit epsilon [Pseudoalteromonas tunicata]MDP5205514.1 F0F1 ATP synthase subunit epsilon [Alishewanella sp. SMS9]MDP5215311.1 F0F1 ATP synthase subunit epsilon [Pseudoalteromonas tunicata]